LDGPPALFEDGKRSAEAIKDSYETEMKWLYAQIRGLITYVDAS